MLSTPRQAVRTGQPIVQLSHALSEEFGDPRHVAVIREIDRRRYQSASHEMTVVAAVQRVPDTELDTAHVRVDQMLRHALGVEIQEQARVVPVSVPRASNGWVAPHRYVLMRVQVADINAVEQQACFMPATQLEILGISPGDVVVVESCTRAGAGPDGPDGPGYEVVTLRLKAYVASDDLIAQRERNSGGGLNARYPSARDALGIYPDLPWIFLDAGSRELLGAHKLSALRVRAAQTYQLSKEMRELTILLMLAAVGASTQISNVWVAAALFALATIASVLFVFLRMRVRLCAVSGSPQVSRPYSARHGTSVE